MKYLNGLKLSGFILFYCCIFLVLISCKTLKNQQVNSNNEAGQVVLGTIGNSKGFLFQNNFKSTALAQYKNPIRVSVSSVAFSKVSYTAFQKAKKLQLVNVNPIFNDSLKNKAKFVSIIIIDKVALMDELNAKHNASIKEYLINQDESEIITGLSMALNPTDLSAIFTADAVYLVNNGHKTYALQLYKDNIATQQIKFNQGVVFAYKTSSSCWQENNKHQLTIIDLVEGGSCPRKAYKYAQRARQNINYFKF